MPFYMNHQKDYTKIAPEQGYEIADLAVDRQKLGNPRDHSGQPRYPAIAQWVSDWRAAEQATDAKAEARMSYLADEARCLAPDYEHVSDTVPEIAAFQGALRLILT